MLSADFGSVTERNPTIAPQNHEGERIYSLPAVNIAFNLQLRYTIKEPRK